MSTSMVPPSSSRVRVLPSASGRVAQVARAYSQNGATPPSSIPVAAVDAKAAVAVSKPKPVPRITLFRAMSFNGPAPELINGRLAMLGFLWASWQEAQTGEMFLSQAMSAPWLAYAIPLLWVYASMVPIMHGALLEPFGIFTPRAELANGRAAMLGFAGVLALEYHTGVPFF